MISPTKIVILDSGLCKSHPIVKKHNGNIQLYNLAWKKGKVIQTAGADDDVGHGTAVFHAISSLAPFSEIIVFKIVGKNYNLEENAFLAFLKYINENVECDIIHISAGLIRCRNKKRLYNICELIKKRNILIVSAFANNGNMTYPAIFDNVIGVDFNTEIIKPSDWIYVEDSPVNIFATGTAHRLAWMNNTYKNIAGASFAAAYITGAIANFLNDGVSIENINEVIKNNSLKVLLSPIISEYNINFPIKHAVVFPFNKENHSLIRYRDMLAFELTHILDIKYNCNIGKMVSELNGFEDIPDQSDMLIENIESLNWNDDFDTFILGHMDLIYRASNIDYCVHIYNKCLQYKKNLYSYDFVEQDIIDKFHKNGLKIFSPTIENRNIIQNQFGKLYSTNSPVLGVFGTSSRQGKWSLQLSIRREMEVRGYKIGQFSTEPTGALFGQPYMYAMGYHSKINVLGIEAVCTINNILNHIDEKNPDLIIVGGQSHTVSICEGGVSVHPIVQHEYITACSPQAVILCINLWDDPEYIKRTILYLENCFYIKVLCLVISPMKKFKEWTMEGMVEKDINIDIFPDYDIPMYSLSNTEHIKEICDIIIKYF